MKNTTQILMVHGGMTFKTKRDYLDFLTHSTITLAKKAKWQNQYLDTKLGSRFEIIRPMMPLKENAKYEEWKIHFEKYISLLGTKYMLIGNSLGGIFLARYLSENTLRHKAQSVFLVCPPYDGNLCEEDLVGGFKLGKDLSLLEKNTKKLHVLFSEDDDVVPVSHAEKYRKKLKSANIQILKGKNGHFKVSTFPEIVKMIKEDSC